MRLLSPPIQRNDKKMEQIHQPSAAVTAGMGRLLTAASIMGVMLKGEDDNITLRFNGDGPAGSIIAVADSSGNGRISVQILLLSFRLTIRVNSM